MDLPSATERAVVPAPLGRTLAAALPAAALLGIGLLHLALRDAALGGERLALGGLLGGLLLAAAVVGRGALPLSLAPDEDAALERAALLLAGLGAAALLLCGLGAAYGLYLAVAGASAMLGGDPAAVGPALLRTLRPLPFSLFALSAGAAASLGIGGVRRVVGAARAARRGALERAHRAQLALPPPSSLVEELRELREANLLLGQVRDDLAPLQREVLDSVRAGIRDTADALDLRARIDDLGRDLGRDLGARADDAALRRAALDQARAAQIEALGERFAAAAAQIAGTQGRLQGLADSLVQSLAQGLTAQKEMGDKVQAAGKAEVQAIDEASRQASRLFMGVSRHLDKTWEQVQEAFVGIRAALEEQRKMKAGVDAIAAKLLSVEQKGQRGDEHVQELSANLDALRDAWAEQGKKFDRFLQQSQAEQNKLAMNVDIIRKRLEQLTGPGAPKRF